MGIWLVPPAVKPGSKVWNKAVHLGYVEERGDEKVIDFPKFMPLIQGRMLFFRDYKLLAFKVRATGEPEDYKIYPVADSMIARRVEEFIDRAFSKDTLAEFEFKGLIIGKEGEELLSRVYKALSKDIRTIIALPLQWMVYVPKKQLLTRLCWIMGIKGTVKVRQYGNRGLALEVDDITFGALNNSNIFKLWKEIGDKQPLNDTWRTWVASELGAESVEGFELTGIGGEEEKTVEEKEEEEAAGEVE